MDVWFAITLLGAPVFWAGLSLFLIGLYFFMRGYGKRNDRFRNFLILMITSLVVVLIATNALKIGFALPRPCTPCNDMSSITCNPYCLPDYSFPSGHASIMFSVFTSGFLVARKFKKQAILGYLIALVVSLSRIMLGVHTLIDVIGGALLGAAVPVLMYNIYKKYKLVKFK